VEKIHTCKNDCILYHREEYEDLEKYPICGLDLFNHRKNDGDDDNCNRRKGGSKKGVLILSYHYSFEALICKQKEVGIVMMA
jgi:hypothetical protein